MVTSLAEAALAVTGADDPSGRRVQRLCHKVSTQHFRELSAIEGKKRNTISWLLLSGNLMRVTIRVEFAL